MTDHGSRSAWAKIRDELCDFMEDLRNTRLAVERSEIFRGRFTLLDDAISGMRIEYLLEESDAKFIDYVLMPECFALLNAPTEPDAFDKDAFQALMVRIRNLKARWLAEQEVSLAMMLEAAMGRLPTHIAASNQGGGANSEHSQYTQLLELAIAVFECKVCTERMQTSDALAHRCARKPGLPWSLYFAGDHPDDEPGTYLYEARTFYPQVCPWNPECFTVPDLEPLRRVLRTCGQDPDVVTAEEMDVLDPRLAVARPDGTWRVMKWEDVVSCVSRFVRAASG